MGSKPFPDKTPPDSSQQPLTWGAFVFLMLAFGLAVLGWFLFNPARAQAISPGKMPIALHSRFEADYSADLRGYALAAVSMDLVSEVIAEEAGPEGSAEQIQRIQESLKTPVPIIQPPASQPTPQPPAVKPTTRPTRAATNTLAATSTASPAVPSAFPTATATQPGQPKPKQPTSIATWLPSQTPTAQKTATRKPSPTNRPTKTPQLPTATQPPTLPPTTVPPTAPPPAPTQEPPPSPTDPPPPRPTSVNPGPRPPKPPRWWPHPPGRGHLVDKFPVLYWRLFPPRCASPAAVRSGMFL